MLDHYAQEQTIIDGENQGSCAEESSQYDTTKHCPIQEHVQVVRVSHSESGLLHACCERDIRQYFAAYGRGEEVKAASSSRLLSQIASKSEYIL